MFYEETGEGELPVLLVHGTVSWLAPASSRASRHTHEHTSQRRAIKPVL